MKKNRSEVVKGTVTVQSLPGKAEISGVTVSQAPNRNSQGNTALITGGTNGIGAAFALAFGALGYNLVLVGLEVPSETRKSLESLVEEHNITATIYKADLATERDIVIIERLINERQDIEVLVNCAGFGLGQTFEGADLSRENAMLKVHCLAPMRLIRAAHPHMRNLGREVIINVSSLGGFFPMAKNTVYGGTKAFLIMLTESLHLELQGTGIKTQVIAPSFVKTHFHDHIVDTSKRIRKQRFLKWMTVDQVIKASFHYLDREKVVCIPGLRNRIIYGLAKYIPRWLYYRLLGGK
jgi:short-subunit dehydrogenase